MLSITKLFLPDTCWFQVWFHVLSFKKRDDKRMTQLTFIFVDGSSTNRSQLETSSRMLRRYADSRPSMSNRNSQLSQIFGTVESYDLSGSHDFMYFPIY